jgi:hypothetical protein
MLDARAAFFHPGIAVWLNKLERKSAVVINH